MGASGARDAAAAWLDAWIRGDTAAFADLHAPYALLFEHSTGMVLETGPEVAAYNLAWAGAFRDLAASVEREFHQGSLVGWQLVWSGVQDGALPLGPARMAPPSGLRMTLPAVLMTTWRDGRIVRQDHYFDARRLHAQLNVAPAAEVSPV